MKINFKLLLLFLEITLIPLIILGFVGYSNAKNEITSIVISKLEAVADIQKDRLVDANEDNLERLKLLTNNLLLKQEIDKYNKTPNGQSQEIIQKVLIEENKALPNIKEISIANLNGDIIFSTNSKSIGLNLSKYEDFQKGKNTNNVTNFSKDQNGLVSLNLTGPLILNNKIVGVLFLTENSSYITEIITSYSGLGQTGETLLVSKNAGGDALFLTPIRFDSNAALSRIVPKEKTRVPSTHAIKGEEKIMTDAIDYDNKPVIAVTRYIPDAKWGIVVKVNQEEAYLPINKLSNLLFFMEIISVIIVIFISFSVAKLFTDPIKKLSHFADEIANKNFTTTTTTTGINSTDEIGMLARSFNTMSIKLKEYYGELEQKVKIRTQDLENSKSAMMNLVEDLENTSRDLKKFKLAIDNISEMVVITNSEGIVIYGNKAVEKITGYKTEEAIGKKSGALWKTPMPVEYYQKLWNTIKIQKKTFVGEIQNKRKNGEIYVAVINISPITNEKGEVEFFVGIERDITKEKEIDRAKTDFISLASHQLRTPLSAMKWFCEMLLNGDAGTLSAEQKEYTQNISESNERMIDLVNSLLNISRIESGRVIIDPVPTDISKLISQIITEIKIKTDQKKQQIIINVDQDIPLVNIDPKLIGEVYANLLTNSSKYTPDGGKIQILISRKNNELVSQITDTGYGILEKEKDQVFSKFFRGENIIKVETDGTGLGLYLVKAIIDSSGGKIWFESQEGKGTTFWFSIPMSGMQKKEGEVTLNT